MSTELATLFADADESAPAVMRAFGVISKKGCPVFYLPIKRGLAARSLALYPAQRLPARMLKMLMRCACQAGATRLLPRVTLRLWPDAPLSQFLGSLTASRGLPDFAVLAGNPNVPGRRYVILVCDSQQRPAAVVKAGRGEPALKLIQQEADLLASAPPGALGIPRLQSVLTSGDVRALALDYLEGRSPPATPSPQMAAVLNSWVDTRRSVSAGEVPCWRRLRESVPQSNLWQKLQHRVEAKPFHPALCHGDFAPWNIKVSPGNGGWQVLDWERGELTGLPCWDWFHYRIQVAILADRLSTSAHVLQIDRWIETEDFRTYAEAAWAWSIRRELLLAYLLYSAEITRPSEGLSTTRELLESLSQRWKSA